MCLFLVKMKTNDVPIIKYEEAIVHLKQSRQT